jgi:hypothetical protein
MILSLLGCKDSDIGFTLAQPKPYVKHLFDGGSNKEAP